MCKRGNHDSIIILETPGVDHKIYWCEKCDIIVGTSEDFEELDTPVKKESESTWFIRKPLKSILPNI